MEARRITGAAYKASSDAVHGAGGRHCEREEEGERARVGKRDRGGTKRAREREGERDGEKEARRWRERYT